MRKYTNGYEVRDGVEYARRNECRNDTTVADWLEWCYAEGLDPKEVLCKGNVHVSWWSPLTEQELTNKREWAESAAARQAKWERETYERLRQQFERSA